MDNAKRIVIELANEGIAGIRNRLPELVTARPRILVTLSSRQRDILAYRCGLPPIWGIHSLRATAEAYKTTVGRVRWLETKALKELQAIIKAEATALLADEGAGQES
jgi:DNA-directed RNA polymerase sigma subunit (sigma70/sigma32)